MDFAFPEFLTLTAPTSEMIKDMERMREQGVKDVFWKDRPERRYAGDFTLPRGCYYSVCSRPDGDDSGTVAKEMNAYRVAGKTGFVHAFDLMKEDSLKALDIASGPRKAFGILIGDKKRFLQASESNADLINSYEYLDHTLSRAVDQPATTSIIVLVPYQVEYREIEKVVDMRLPRVQEWFFERFHLGDGEALNKPNGGNIRSFLQMLPTLMSYPLGGNMITSAIGAWMRNKGANAMIFPSARCDVAVTIKDGSLADWFGWNLVDYRAAVRKPAISSWADFSPWQEKVWKTQYTRLPPPRARYSGSWQVVGNEAWQDLAFAEAAGVYPWRRRWRKTAALARKWKATWRGRRSP